MIRCVMLEFKLLVQDNKIKNITQFSTVLHYDRFSEMLATVPSLNLALEVLI